MLLRKDFLKSCHRWTLSVLLHLQYWTYHEQAKRDIKNWIFPIKCFVREQGFVAFPHCAQIKYVILLANKIWIFFKLILYCRSYTVQYCVGTSPQKLATPSLLWKNFLKKVKYPNWILLSSREETWLSRQKRPKKHLASSWEGINEHFWAPPKSNKRGRCNDASCTVLYWYTTSRKAS